MDSAGLLSVGRAAFQGITGKYGRIGLSANSRQSLEDFYNNATSLFNQLYTSTENQQLYNTVTIKALRAKHKSSMNADDGAAAASTTTGIKVNTQA